MGNSNVLGNTTHVITKTDDERFQHIVKIFASGYGVSIEKLTKPFISSEKDVVVYTIEIKLGENCHFIFHKIDENRVVLYQQRDFTKTESLKYEIYQLDLSSNYDIVERYQSSSANPFRSGSHVYKFKPNTIFTTLIIKFAQNLIE